MFALQQARGLEADGVCDRTTWLALVEASWRLGDRLLVLTAPNMRGDDIAELQTVLARLGFDCGRVDGILGPGTQEALVNFQRNCGLVADGVCGPATVNALELMARQTGTGPGVAVVREMAQLAAADLSLARLRIVVGEFGGMSSVTRQVIRSLRMRGATVAPADEPDAAAQAGVANRFAAAVYLGFEGRTEPAGQVAYYSVPAFTSPGGNALADYVAERLTAAGIEAAAVGLRHPILRETRMPAVLCSLGPVAWIHDRAPAVAGAVTAALGRWVRDPLGPATLD